MPIIDINITGMSLVCSYNIITYCVNNLNYVKLCSDLIYRWFDLGFN